MKPDLRHVAPPYRNPIPEEQALSYVLLTGPKKEPVKLANKVTLMMADGWRVQGGVQASGQLLYQAMTKRPIMEDRVALASDGGWQEPP